MTTLPDRYFDAAGAAIGGGYRVMYLRAGLPTKQAIFACAQDVATCALFCEAAVLSRDPDIRAACQARGVRLAAIEVGR